MLFNRTICRGLLLLSGALLGRPAPAQTVPATAPRRPFTIASEATQPHLDYALRQVLGQAQVLSPAELRSANPALSFGQSRAGTTVLVRVLARDVAAVLPALQARGFAAVGSAPALHFAEGWLPVSQLAAVGALASQGLLGVVACWAPATNSGKVTSQGDFVLEAARARATPRAAGGPATGSGVTVGVISNSFNRRGGARADSLLGDLPSAGVRVLREQASPANADSSNVTDEGRAMCQIIHDLAPGAALAFCTGGGSELALTQSIRDLADPTQGNCRVLVDDVESAPLEPMFQDGVVAQAITDVVASRGVAYFSAAGNYASQSYENTAPQFITAANGGRYLNFDPSGATQDVTQRLSIPDGASFRPGLQWSDPFYTTNGVRTDLDLFLVAVKAGAAPDTLARSTTRNISLGLPAEFFSFVNNVSQTGTTTFDLVITLKRGQVPSRLKYLDFNQTAKKPTITEWDTQSSTIVGHAAAAAAMAVAAVAYNRQQQAPEPFTSRGGALPVLFAPGGAALASPTTRQKPDIAAIDNVNNTFFGTDFERDGFPNFSGTSAAAPHAAAVAALLRSAEPGLTPTQVYGRLVGSARPLGSSASPDAFTGPGLLDAFTALFGPVAAVAPPLAEGFEQGALPTSWAVYGTGAARAQVSGQAPATGLKSLVLDAYPYNINISSLTEATLAVQGAASARSLTLSFRARKFVAETDEPMPASFTGHSNADGVALSVDGGTTWYRAADLTGANATTSFQTQTIDLTQLAGTLGLTLGNDVRLRFQRYGVGGTTAASPAAAGRAFDDVAVNATALSVSAAANTSALEAWPVPAPGGSALHLRLPAFSGATQVQLLDNLGRVVWQRQLTQSGAPWEGTLPLPATAGFYTLLYQPEGAPAAARRVVVQ